MRRSLLTLSLILIGSFSLAQQTFQEYLRDHRTKDMTFPEMERAFHDWAQTVDLSTTRGWKAQQRWIDFQSRRANGDGSLYDEGLALQEAMKVVKQKEARAMMKTTTNKWVPVGPNVVPAATGSSLNPGIGRMNCVAFHPTDTNTLWVGVAQGGVWKTTDHGGSWTPLTDDLPILRISDIAVNPVDPDTMYIAVGDFEYIDWWLKPNDKNRQTHFGLGIYKTTDGGMTWDTTGFSVSLTDEDFSLTRRILIDPDNRDHLLVAGTYGIYKSLDGGDNWVQQDTGVFMDLERDPSNPDVVYASRGILKNQGYGSAGIQKSLDFGDTWTTLATGIPTTGAVGRIEVEVSPTDPDYVYALCVGFDEGFYGIYRSTNAGASWALRATSPNVLTWDVSGGGSGGQGMYDLALLVHPRDRDIIYTGGVNMWVSENGGAAWDVCTFYRDYYGASIHADIHQMEYNPLTDKIYVMNDGGVHLTDTVIPGLGTGSFQTNWDDLNDGMQATSFYRLGISENDPDYLIAGAQDNATAYYNGSSWEYLIGGDGMDCMLDPDDGEKIWGSWQYGNFQYSDNGGASFSSVAGDIFETGEWTTPMEIHPDTSDIVYFGYGNLYRSDDRGFSNTPISSFPNVPGLGGPNLISHFAIAPSDPQTIYLAKRVYHGYGQSGEVFVTRNGGGSWTNITGILPDSLYFHHIEIDANNPDTAWVAVGGHVDGAKVFKTTNGGSSWTNISGTLPNISMTTFAFDPVNANNPIYLGTDVGVYYRNDTMSDWMLYSDDLPNVIIGELRINKSTGKLYAATFGRGIWEVDVLDSTITSRPKPLTGPSLELYPNPSNGRFTIEAAGLPAGPAQLRIVNVMGAEVFTAPVSLSDQNWKRSMELDLADGVYWLIMDTPKGRHSQKFMVK